MENFGSFVIFGVNLRFFIIWKTQIISSEKTTRQQNSAMLSVLNFLIFDDHRKFDKSCMKTSKIGKFLVFRHFWVFFFPKKPHLSLHKRRLLDNKFLSC